jgi:hypothetical protein
VRKSVAAPCTLHHAVEDHDDLRLGRVRQPRAGLQLARPTLDVKDRDVLDGIRAEGGRQMIAKDRARVAQR